MSERVQTIRRRQAWKDGLDVAGKTAIDGAMRGNIHAKIVLVGSTGRLDGNIYGEQVEICGAVTGSICARQIALRAGAQVHGVLIVQELEIDAGAYFEGKCRSLTRLMAEAARKQSVFTLPLAAE